MATRKGRKESRGGGETPAEERYRYLAEASELLAESLDYERTLAHVAELAVPRLADWAAVDVFKGDGTLKRLAVAHVDPSKVELAHELDRRYPPDLSDPAGLPNVLRTGRSEFYPEITDEVLEAVTHDPEHLRIVRELGLRSGLIVPLVARGRTLGAITFVMAESGRRYTEADLSFAEDLARRGAIAVDNARLVREAQEAAAARDAALTRLRESQARLTRLFESNLIGVLFADFVGNVTDANDAFLRLVGYAREDLTAGRVRWAELTPPEYAALDAEKIAEARSTGAAVPWQKEYIRSDGSRVPVLVGFTMLGGPAEECVAFVLDLTELRRAEEARRATEGRFRTLTDAMPQLVWASDAGGRHLYFNSRWYEYTGLSEAESLDYGFANALHPDDKARTLESWRRAWGTGEPYEIEYRFRRHDGEYRWFLGRATPVRDEAGRIVQWVGTCTDIEEQKQMEALLGRLNSERERMLEEVSTPVVPVLEGVLVMPLIGSLDSVRMERATRAALEEVTRTGARALVIDITGARIVDSHAVANLSNLVAALRLVGAEPLVTGIGAHVAQNLVGLGLDLKEMRTHRTLAQAVAGMIGGAGLPRRAG
ncbi:MAG TPA: PAS domain S-box protein [Pyrinomonadaceae bacterium]|nr:PAS domain S-box protein [Pyrinomonadaceae bacterium]